MTWKKISNNLENIDIDIDPNDLDPAEIEIDPNDLDPADIEIAHSGDIHIYCDDEYCMDLDISHNIEKTHELCNPNFCDFAYFSALADPKSCTFSKAHALAKAHMLGKHKKYCTQSNCSYIKKLHDRRNHKFCDNFCITKKWLQLNPDSEL